MQRFKKIIKIVAAIMVFVFMFNCVQNILVGGSDSNRTTKRFNGFYRTEKNTLDAVLLGSSASYAFFMAPYVWNEYGITVYSFTSSAQPIQAAQFLIEDARKTQPDALYIVNLSAIRSNVSQERFHILFSDMPFSVNKLRAIDYICDSYEYTFEEKMQYVVPIVKFHERWANLKETDFQKLYDDYKTGNSYSSFLKLSVDVGSIGYVNEETISPLYDNIYESVKDLLDYCAEDNVNVMFIITPQVIKNKNLVGMINNAKSMAEEYGFPVLDMRENSEEIGLDYEVDYYNKSHANMHGALKTSTYLAEYLIDNYDFEDKRGNSDYQDWDEAYMRYYYECLEPNLIEADNEYFNAPLPDKEAWEALQEEMSNI